MLTAIGRIKGFLNVAVVVETNSNDRDYSNSRYIIIHILDDR